MNNKTNNNDNVKLMEEATCLRCSRLERFVSTDDTAMQPVKLLRRSANNANQGEVSKQLSGCLRIHSDGIVLRKASTSFHNSRVINGLHA